MCQVSEVTLYLLFFLQNPTQNLPDFHNVLLLRLLHIFLLPSLYRIEPTTTLQASQNPSIILLSAKPNTTLLGLPWSVFVWWVRVNVRFYIESWVQRAGWREMVGWKCGGESTMPTKIPEFSVYNPRGTIQKINVIWDFLNSAPGLYMKNSGSINRQNQAPSTLVKVKVKAKVKSFKVWYLYIHWANHNLLCHRNTRLNNLISLGRSQCARNKLCTQLDRLGILFTRYSSLMDRQRQHKWDVCLTLLHSLSSRLFNAYWLLTSILGMIWTTCRAPLWPAVWIKPKTFRSRVQHRTHMIHVWCA